MSTLPVLSLEDTRLHLAAIVGDEYADLREGSVTVAPADIAQIAATLRFAYDNEMAVIPGGGGTKRGWGNPVAAPIRLSTKRLRSVREHSWHDMTCTVEAGASWSAMQAELARHGQMVALDPLWPDHATVGGIAAVNDSGALRLRYGGLRDLILGMTIVLADGTIAKTGGKVVKNVAGYDLHKLMTGSFGTLGVIAEVNFRLHPIEEHTRTWSVTVTDAAQFSAPLRALLDAQIVPSSVQMRVEREQCAVEIKIAAVPECLDEHRDQLKAIFAPLAFTESKEEVWQARQELFDGGYPVLLKASLLPTTLCTVLSELQQRAASQGVEVHALAQATGLTTIALRAAAEPLAACIADLRETTRESGGSVVALQLPDEVRGRLDVWAYSSDALPLMREIKRRFDPRQILNPGRFVGNI
ncbi:MAG TPA: FAD-binding oxidoreductase [Terracidiphilus sp.]|jgi:glycolate oxidase FAD binding subunit